MLYSLIQINESSPYRVLEYEEDTACFVTDGGVVYMVGFILETNMDIPDAYQLFITPRGRTKNVGIDAKIGQTIAEIVKSFFKNHDNILVYICDTSDKMQAARHRKFQMWFHQYAGTKYFEFISETINVEEDEYFAAMIMKKSHKHFHETINTFHQYFCDLREKLG